MKIKSGVWQWLALASGGAGLAFALGFAGDLDTIGTASDTQFIAAMALLLMALFFLRLYDAAAQREQAAKRRYGRITRSHARNTEYPELPEHRRGA